MTRDSTAPTIQHSTPIICWVPSATLGHSGTFKSLKDSRNSALTCECNVNIWMKLSSFASPASALAKCFPYFLVFEDVKELIMSSDKLGGFGWFFERVRLIPLRRPNQIQLQSLLGPLEFRSLKLVIFAGMVKVTPTYQFSYHQCKVARSTCNKGFLLLHLSFLSNQTLFLSS